MSTEEVTQIDRSPDAKSAMEKMKSQIEEIAKERANQLISEAQAKCDQILEEANKEAEATTKKLVDEARSEAEKKKAALTLLEETHQAVLQLEQNDKSAEKKLSQT